ncbi:uncharacterized protein LOC122811520 [Protopterus annectens]|uniref:uncharacterized protein LOC122811520 n=1 Tax=Protopterus annectens TaxID=7888 RepID=UPI001CF98852|nr:uncharacterized protein LOC122811520 [Protopterus annectens]
MAFFTKLALSETARQAVLKELPAAAAVSRATCRSLFGPVDHEELKKDLKEQLKEMQSHDRLKWNFDFNSETPLPGVFAWESLKSENLPNFYRDIFYSNVDPNSRPLSAKEQRTLDDLQWKLSIQTNNRLLDGLTYDRVKNDKLPSVHGESSNGAEVVPSTAVFGEAYPLGKGHRCTESQVIEQTTLLGSNGTGLVKKKTLSSGSPTSNQIPMGTNKRRAAGSLKRANSAKKSDVTQNPITDYFTKRKRTTVAGPPKVTTPRAILPLRQPAEALSEVHRKLFR